MDLQLNDKTVLVTGAGQGLGRAIGLAFSREGTRVAFHYNASAEGAEKAATEVNAAGGAALAVQADLRDDAAVEAAVEQAEERLGPVSVLVNNAAATQRKRFLDTTAADWQAQVDVTVTGMLRVTHAVARRMAERDGGSIVSLLGDSGRVGESGLLVTATARSSTVGLTKSLAKELARHQIRANAVSIALVQTDSLDAHTGGTDDDRMRKILAQYPLRRLGRRTWCPWCCCSPRPCLRGLPVRSFPSTAGTRCREGGPMKDAVGQPVPRKEDLRLITGRGTYVSDLQLPRTRHVAFLRSPHAHARITAIDTSQARQLAGVTAVFTGQDQAFKNTALRAQSALPGYVETAQPVLATSKTRFAGEAVAAVVAGSRYLAEDALALIDVDYAPLPVTVSAWQTPGSVRVHDEAPDNVLLSRTFAAGDVEAAFAAADLVAERELITNRHGGNPLEGRAGLALWQPERRRLTFWSGTQVPHIVRNMLAALLGLAESSVQVIAPDVGGGFGVKSVLYPEDVALCLMAQALPGTPVSGRGPQRAPAGATTRAPPLPDEGGLQPGRRLLALQADITCNVGAYSVYPWTAGIEPLMAGGLLSGPYRLANYDCTVCGVATNTAPGDRCRPPGQRVRHGVGHRLGGPRPGLERGRDPPSQPHTAGRHPLPDAVPAGGRLRALRGLPGQGSRAGRL